MTSDKKTLPRSTEATDAGEQVLVPCVRPITMRDRLDWLARQPMAPRRNPMARQRPCNIGLFDEDGRRQMDWIDEAKKHLEGDRQSEGSGPSQISPPSRGLLAPD